jgi:hypothetical protein
VDTHELTDLIEQLRFGPLTRRRLLSL